MSLGTPTSVPDIYEFSARFLYLNTNESLLNSDSYALFAGAISEGIPVTLLFPVIGGGAALAGQGALTWQARFYFGLELQHPVLSVFNPTVGIGLSLIGVPDRPDAPSLQPSNTTSVSRWPVYA